MQHLLTELLLALYFITASLLALYGLNAYLMLYLFRRGILKGPPVSIPADSKTTSEKFPVVTTQIPVYNEYNVTERIIRAVAAMKYPQGKHEIQILDDSNDETSALIDRVVSELKADNCQNTDIHILRRGSREGFKAGALAEGMKLARGEILAIFDADFCPDEDFLLKSVPYFLANKNCGLVQCRWGHINRRHSFLTRAQAIGIDGHFMIEQLARSRNGLFMNFNGTAGLWRREAITAAGGWEWDTLTEDMDLSYRMQLAGWEAIFIPEIVAPAEIPQNVSAFRSQQFRWAKGSIQTAIKLMPEVLRSNYPVFARFQAFMHMTHYLVHPLMLTQAILSLPIILLMNFSLTPVIFALLALLLIVAMCAPSALYTASQRYLGGDWKKRLLILPLLTCAGTGLAISNTRAVLEALLGINSEFIRTPKSGSEGSGIAGYKSGPKKYFVKARLMPFIEIACGSYCAFSFLIYINSGRWLIGPFLAIYACGFMYLGILDLLQGVRERANS